jgi:hypothetical protein
VPARCFLWSEPERLDILPATTEGPAPIFMFIHAGYGRLLDSADSSFMAECFTQAHDDAGVDGCLCAARCGGATSSPSRRASCRVKMGTARPTTIASLILGSHRSVEYLTQNTVGPIDCRIEFESATSGAAARAPQAAMLPVIGVATQKVAVIATMPLIGALQIEAHADGV